MKDLQHIVWITKQPLSQNVSPTWLEVRDQQRIIAAAYAPVTENADAYMIHNWTLHPTFQSYILMNTHYIIKLRDPLLI